MRTIDVNLETQSYRISIESDLLAKIGVGLSTIAPSPRAAVVVDSNVAETHGETMFRSLRESGYEVATQRIDATEANKTLDTVRVVYDFLLKNRFDRRSPIIALGGGIVGDTAGFAAATFMRGAPLVQVPTTLLAMVDASIGGKTGVNYPLPEIDDSESSDAGGSKPSVGKNMIGSFYQPRAVFVDPQTLTTLDERQFNCGLAESIKHGVIGERLLLDYIVDNIAALRAHDSAVLGELIERSAKIKVDIVQDDVHESNKRELLNLGHTFAHVIEPIAELELFHGEAVAIGLIAAAHCSVKTGRLSPDDAELLRSVIEAAGLPTMLSKPFPGERLLSLMAFDKKTRGGKLRLILPTALGSAEVVDDVPGAIVQSAWESVGAEFASATAS